MQNNCKPTARQRSSCSWHLNHNHVRIAHAAAWAHGMTLRRILNASVLSGNFCAFHTACCWLLIALPNPRVDISLPLLRVDALHPIRRHQMKTSPAASCQCRQSHAVAWKPTLTPQQAPVSRQQQSRCHALNWQPVSMQTVLRQLSRMQQARHCTAALPAPLDSLTAAAAPLQQDQVAAAITIAVALAWVKMFAVLTSSGVLEQVMVCIKQQRVLHARLSLAN